MVPARHLSWLVLSLLFALPVGAADQPQSELLAEAKITEAQAQKIALRLVPGGKVQSSGLEMERGKLIWSVDIAIPGSKYVKEVWVNAKTGKVVLSRIESPADQAREGKSDMKAKPKEK